MQPESQKGRRHTRNSGAWNIGWYVRLVLYLIVLAAVLLTMRTMRGRIPQAFGLTPIRVEALSVSPISGSTRGTSSADAVADSAGGIGDIGGSNDRRTDYSVSVRIVGSDSVPTPILLGQFLLETDGGQYMAFASDLVFARSGTLDVAPGDTLFGVLIYSVPDDETPEELWWRP